MFLLCLWGIITVTEHVINMSSAFGEFVFEKNQTDKCAMHDRGREEARGKDRYRRRQTDRQADKG